MNRAMLKYTISESFNVVRWCLIALTFAFVAIISVAKYIQLSDATSITFSSFEITYMILNDTVSVVYIYLPLYLFMICGLMFDDNFGSLEVLKSGSRSKWLSIKYWTLLFYTVCYFVFLVGMNFLIANQVFPFSAKWSQDFMNVQVLMGQNPKDFVYGPLQTIGISLGAVLLLYMTVGAISVWVALVTRKEAYALLASLAIGIATSILFVYGLELTSQRNMQAFTIQAILLGIMMLLAYLCALWVVRRQDFHIAKKH